MDEQIRDLERQAAAGDPSAQGKLFMARVRAGEIAPEEVERLAVGCDRLALEALGEKCGDRAVLSTASGKTKFTSGQAAEVLEAWYRAHGYARDQRSSSGALISRDEKTKITFAARVWRKFSGGRGNWHMIDSGSLPKTAEAVVANARLRVNKDKTAVTKFKEKRTKQRAAAVSRKVKAEDTALFLRAAVVEVSLGLTPQDRRAIMLDKESQRNYTRDVFDLAERNSLPAGATEESIDAQLSIAEPPIPLERDTYKVRGTRVAYSGQHAWTDRGLKRPVRVWHPEGEGEALGVEIGSMPVDPFGMRVTKASMIRSLVGEGKPNDGLVGTLRVTRDNGLWGGYLFMIVTSPKRSGAGTRYLRAWCHLLQAYGTEAVWVAQAVGPEGEAWLQELDRRGEIEITSRSGSHLVVQCVGALDEPGQQRLFPPAPRKNPDDSLRRAEREASKGDPRAAVQLDVERYRHGQPSVLGDLVRHAQWDVDYQPDYEPAPGVLANREASRQVAEVNAVGRRLYGDQYWSDVAEEEGPWVLHVGYRDNRDYERWLGHERHLEGEIQRAGYRTSWWFDERGRAHTLYVHLDANRIRLARDLHEEYVSILRAMRRERA